MRSRTGENSVREWMVKIQRAMEERLSRRDANKRLSTKQLAAIAFLRGRENRATTIGELQTFLGVSHPTVSGIIREMEKQGFLSVSVDTRDRRARLLTLSESVSEAFADVRQRDEETEEILLRGFDEEERAQLFSMFARMYENIR